MQAQIEADRPVQAVGVAGTQQDIYAKLYDSLQQEIVRLQASNTKEQADLKKDYEAQIKTLKDEIVSLKSEVQGLKATVERTYSEEITVRNKAIATLQAEVAELKRTVNNN